MSDTSRRKLLKSIVAGSGAVVAGKSLPESWSRPVVDSVMLPAHAQTSPSPNCSTDPVTNNLTQDFTDFAGDAYYIPASGEGPFSQTVPISGDCTDGSTGSGDFVYLGTTSGPDGSRTVTGSYTYELSCGGIPTCTGSATYTGTETGANFWDMSVSGTFTCCEDRQTTQTEIG